MKKTKIKNKERERERERKRERERERIVCRQNLPYDYISCQRDSICAWAHPFSGAKVLLRFKKNKCRRLRSKMW